MKLSWDSEAEERYENLNNRILERRSWNIAALGAVLFPLFSFLDIFTQREHLLQLSVLRYSAAAVFIFFFFGIKNKWIKLPPIVTSFLLFMVASFSIAFMCALLGGFVSPYYAGMNLILLAAALLLPVNEKKMLFFVTFIVGIYVFVNIFATDLNEKSVEILINNMSFILGTGIIAVTAAYVTERLRKESYLRYLELDRAQSFLRGELKSSQNSIQNMLQEISNRRRELEKALEEAESARGEAQRALQIREDFISLASHELNTPLTSLKLQTQVAQLKMKTIPEDQHSPLYKNILTIYDTQLKRLIRMVDDMLDVSRIKKGKFALELQEVELANIIREVVDRTPSTLLTSEVNLKLEAGIHTQLDLYRFEQVLLNLLTNGLKYGLKRPITISLFREEDVAVIEFIDQGIGIQPSLQTKIFQQFERAVSPQEYTGLGLGLFISRQIIEAHGGTISVESEPGLGSTFRIILPL